MSPETAKGIIRLSAHPDWKHFEEYLESIKLMHTSELETGVELPQIYRAQGKLRLLRDLLIIKEKSKDSIKNGQ